MTFLIIIGWFMITLGAGGSLFAPGVILSTTLGFTGKAGFEWIFPFCNCLPIVLGIILILPFPCKYGELNEHPHTVN